MKDLKDYTNAELIKEFERRGANVWDHEKMDNIGPDGHYKQFGIVDEKPFRNIIIYYDSYEDLINDI